MPMQATPFVYVGTYTDSGSQGRAEGIFVYRFDSATGALRLVSSMADVVNPSFLAFDPTYRYVYAVNEVSTMAGQAGGAVSAFAIDHASGGLKLLNQQRSHGAAPCYLSVDQTGRWLLGANYGGGSIFIMPIAEDGRLKAATSVIRHGSDQESSEQPTAHAHALLPDPRNRFVLATDLGLDTVFVYRLDTANGTLTTNDPPGVQSQTGAGPRHLAFHPNGRYVFVINELDSTLSSYAYDADDGRLEPIHTASTLPAGWDGENSGADLHLAPSGRFAYGSNRGHNSIAVFAIDEQTGRFTIIEHVATQGATPRNFALDPAGEWLIVANQTSNTLVTLRVDRESGTLTATGNTLEVPSPVCVMFLQPAAEVVEQPTSQA